MIPICDHFRHLVVYPYTIHNLHKVAKELGINRCWYKRAGRLEHPHYDIPYKLIGKIEWKCIVVTKREMANFVHKGTLPPSLIKRINPV